MAAVSADDDNEAVWSRLERLATARLTQGFVRWGVDQARRAWVTRKDVINTMPLPQLLRLLARHRAAG
jgi:hypothetical protein